MRYTYDKEAQEAAQLAVASYHNHYQELWSYIENIFGLNLQTMEHQTEPDELARQIALCRYAKVELKLSFGESTQVTSRGIHYQASSLTLRNIYRELEDMYPHIQWDVMYNSAKSFDIGYVKHPSIEYRVATCSQVIRNAYCTRYPCPDVDYMKQVACTWIMYTLYMNPRHIDLCQYIIPF